VHAPTSEHLIRRHAADARLDIGAIAVDRLTFDGALSAILKLVDDGQGGTVFTPNVDHVVRAEHDLAFRAAYRRASLSVVDGMPLVWASYALGAPLPEKISGSDWLEPLLARCSARGDCVYFLGGRRGAGRAAQLRLQERYPALRVVGVGPRTRDVEADPTILTAVVRELQTIRPNLAVVALGSPLQELWSDEVRSAVAPTVLLGLGSALDVAAGMIQRAPRWMSQAGLEWLYRLAKEPRRLSGRYLTRDPAFAWIVARQLARR
jgi:N-acetylglucosaminyldiphosphoundecaprenol N-acetyl-beta-D-mannosaminyltransferase